MSKNNSIFIIFLFSCILLSISFASANDNIALDDSSYDVDYQNKMPSVNNDDLSAGDIDADSSNNSSITKSKSFTDLNNVINGDLNRTEIILNDDYVYQEDSDVNLSRGIFINKSVVIDGNGHSIDAQNKSKIFNIHTDNVIIKNITFMNANGNQKVYDYTNSTDDEIFIDTNIPHSFPMVLDGYVGFEAVVYNSEDFYDTGFNMLFHSTFTGGAIYCNGNNLTIVNSSFVNNSASCGGGIYVDGANTQLINVLFFNNVAEEGGAIFNSGINTFIVNSQFNLNHALYGSHSICSYKDINIQMCNFTNSSQMSIFYGDWQINNMTSTYFDSFVKFGYINFKFNLTHIQNDYYNFKITFGYHPYWMSEEYIYGDKYGFSVNKKFCLNVDGVVYNLQTDSNSQASLYLNLSNGVHDIEVYNPITKLGLSKVFNVSDSNEGNTSDTNSTTGNDASSDSDIKNSTSSNTETNTNTTKTNQNMENSTNVTEFNQDIGNNTNVTEPSRDVANNTNATEPSRDVANNTNVAEPNQDMRNNTNINQNTSSTSHRTINTKFSPNVIAKNKKFNKKTRVKKYSLTLKNKSKPIKNVWITLKIKGKTFKAKTNNKGQATFKITTLNKKGKFAAKIIFKGNKYYSFANKNVKIVVK